MLFAITFPEVLTGMAAEQWRSARQSVEDFSNLGQDWDSALRSQKSSANFHMVKLNFSRLKSSPWTMRHAFFADMGGYLLSAPDLRPFPIDGQQLFYLVQNHYIDYPDVTESTIWDKNKADGFARLITLFQITWFLVQSIGRAVQGLDISTLELSTLAFIFCTMNTFFFWRHKPLDVVTPILLDCHTRLEDILSAAGIDPSVQYSETPLDFVKPSVSRSSLVAPFWLGLSNVLDWRRRRSSLPIRSFDNSRTTPPRGVKLADMLFAIVFTFSYFAIHLIGWNFAFPSKTEQVLWRAASLTLLGSLVVYYLAILLGQLFARRMAKFFFDNDKEKNIFGLATLLPRWVAILTHSPLVIVYTLVRTYIIVEGFASLRTLPLTAFDDVDWMKAVGS